MSKTKIGLFVAIPLLVAAIGVSQQPKTIKGNDLQTFMHKKLGYSQAVLEGVVTDDPEKIAKYGQALSLLSLEAGWQVLQTSEYAEQSLAFRKAANRLTVAGREENLDGAALAYVDLTMRCVECHRYVRSQNTGIKARR